MKFDDLLRPGWSDDEHNFLELPNFYNGPQALEWIKKYDVFVCGSGMHLQKTQY